MPQQYAVHTQYPKSLARLRNDSNIRGILTSFDEKIIAPHYPINRALVMDVVPADFRIFATMPFMQIGKTGGSSTGYNKIHIDRYSRLNVFMQTGGKYTSGGITVLCHSKKGPQLIGFPFEDGTIIGGNFQQTYHGTTNWFNGRAAIGAYVEERLLKFCLLYQFKEDPCPWNIAEVGEWLKFNGFSRYCQIFEMCQINGEKLLCLDHDDLEVSCGLHNNKIRNNILSAIQRERWEEREEKDAVVLFERFALAQEETSK